MAARVHQSVKDAIKARIIAGEYSVDIARACGVSGFTVRGVARREGLVIQVSPNGMVNLKRNRNAKPKNMTLIETEQHKWRALAANARWGAGLGS